MIIAKRFARAAGWGLALFASALLLDGFSGPGRGILVGDAQARIGRPATPVSVAGVARRTTRRRIRRTAIMVASLPPNCTTVVIEGTTLSQCGGTYYQASGTQYVVVNVE